MKILYAEDESFTRKIVKRLIENEQHTVLEASNGVLGLKKFIESKPDIVITDLSMPEMDGFELVSRIRSMNSDIPIIVTTAYREETEKLSGMRINFLYKPIVREQLIRSINNAFHPTTLSQHEVF